VTRGALAPEIEILGAPQSVYVRATLMALEEKGAPYRVTPTAPHSPQALALNPFGKIPAMRRGALTLFESRAIIAYVDRAFPGPSLMPDDAEAAAKIEQWISAVNTSVFPRVIGYMQANAMPRGSNGRRDEATVRAALPAVQATIEILNQAVGSDHLAGPDFSLADIYLMPMMGYLVMFPESAEMIKASRNLARYFALNSTRPSYVATTPPPMEQLRG
jgi:glutathione S-transferase